MLKVFSFFNVQFQFENDEVTDMMKHNSFDKNGSMSICHCFRTFASNYFAATIELNTNVYNLIIIRLKLDIEEIKYFEHWFKRTDNQTYLEYSWPYNSKHHEISTTKTLVNNLWPLVAVKLTIGLFFLVVCFPFACSL